jgi:hypothetical protein
MRALLGDRFLRRFSGGLKHSRENQNSTGEGKNPEAEVAAVAGPETVQGDIHASEGDREETEPDTNDVSNKAEPSKQNEISPKAD